MKDFIHLVFNPLQCKKELDEFSLLLASKAELSERHDIQPFFKERLQLSAFIGTCIPDMGPANRLAYEFPIFGDFVADIVIGNFERKTFCVIELEDGRSNSIFSQMPGRSTAEWGRRLEHGFGQLVDWFFVLDDQKNGAAFCKHFGYGHIRFFGMLIVGRSAAMSQHDDRRLQWRSDNVSVGSHHVYCRTFDDLRNSLDNDWRLLSLVSKVE